jgi:hypothetical protein
MVSARLNSIELVMPYTYIPDALDWSAGAEVLQIPKVGRTLPRAMMFRMDAFPEFMKQPANRIAKDNRETAGVAGYGVEGSQMAFWICAVL